jgi:hypothetical protein
MYKLSPNSWDGTPASSVIRTTDGACIPFDPANTDYQTFKYYLEEKDSQGNPTGITPELKDAEGNDMTAEQITTFLGTLK